MALATGTRLGPYEVVSALGAGGMGEVYQARDTRLDRTVAIKVLPPELSADPERRARFEREARTIAALNHPHICTLFDVGEAELVAPCLESPSRGPVRATYLVMEHLVGETLAQRLRRGALPIAQALEIGAQVADALDAAHTHGIVHRDLKPSNVMLTANAAGRSGIDAAKLLDFGLAKLRESAARPAAHPAEPIATEPLTQAGEVLGTRPYMAPEQVEGKVTDARTDLWALGCVLYEMVTGRAAFTGESVAGITAAILDREPEPLTTSQPLIPPALDHVVHKCLAKAPEARWQSARDVADELRWIREGAAPHRPAARSRHIAWTSAAAAMVAVVLVASVAWALWNWMAQPAAPSAAVVHSQLDVGPADELSAGGAIPRFVTTPGGSRTALAWTPDGQTLVFVGRRGGTQQLYARRLDTPEARPLPGTEGAQAPAVSADGRWVAFWAGRAIRKVPIGGGPAGVVVPDVGLTSGLSWDESGRLYFEQGGIWVHAPDGPPTAVTTLGDGEQFHTLPHALPGGRVVLFTVRQGRWSWGRETVVAHEIAGGARKVLLQDATDARYVPTGHLVFLRRGQLMAVPFDPDHLEVHGAPEVILDGVAQSVTAGNLTDTTGAGQYAIARNGTLAWLPGGVAPYREGRLVTVDRHGQVTPLSAPARSYTGAVRVSPDGRRLALSILGLTEVSLWVFDMGRGILAPVIKDGETFFPLWSRDGTHLLFCWLKDGRWSFATQLADSAAVPQVLARGMYQPSSLAPDGQNVLAVPGGGGGDLLLLTLVDGGAQVQPVLQTGHAHGEPVFSPDGRWVAYTSIASGQDHVYVRPYPGPGLPQQVSLDGGWNPIFHPSGRELFFVSRTGARSAGVLMAADFDVGPPLRIGVPRQLFDFSERRLLMSSIPIRQFDIAPDGRHFYAVQWSEPAPQPAVTHINLVQHWFEELKAKVPVAR